MRIRKSQLRRIIQEEVERKLLQENVSVATPMAMQMLNDITRSGGQREAAISLMQAVFKQLGGDGALEAMKAAVEQQEAEWKRRGSSWISK